MIQFKELRITPDKKHLVVECNITKSAYYSTVYISQIIIDTLKTFVSTGPSTKPILSKTYDDDNLVVREVFDIDSISDNMFFVYVIAKGTPADTTPCGMTNDVILGVVFDKEKVYSTSMKMLHELDGCDIPRNFIDYALKLEAFELAIHIGEYTKAIEYWNTFFSNNSTTSITSNCGCHGGI